MSTACWRSMSTVVNASIALLFMFVCVSISSTRSFAPASISATLFSNARSVVKSIGLKFSMEVSAQYLT